MSSSDSENDGESAFESLAPSKRARIDSAFDTALTQDSSTPSSSNPRIPVVLLPTALALLGLPGDDVQILGVCRSAAERGYLGRSRWREVCAVLLEGDDDDDDEMDVDDETRSGFVEMDGGFVPESSLPPSGGGFIADDTGGGFLPDDGIGGGFLPEDSAGGGFIPEDSGGGGFLPDSDAEDEPPINYSDPDDSSDEYVEPTTSKSKSKSKSTSKKRRQRDSLDSSAPTSRKRTKRTRHSSPLTSDDDEDAPPVKGKGKASLAKAKRGGLTADEEEHAQHVFSLFLGDGPDLLNRRIMISDIQRVAGLLKEKITAEEIVEMLEVFSTSADKSVGWEDFQKIMITTKTF